MGSLCFLLQIVFFARNPAIIHFSRPTSVGCVFRPSHTPWVSFGKTGPSQEILTGDRQSRLLLPHSSELFWGVNNTKCQTLATSLRAYSCANGQNCVRTTKRTNFWSLAVYDIVHFWTWARVLAIRRNIDIASLPCKPFWFTPNCGERERECVCVCVCGMGPSWRIVNPP